MALSLSTILAVQQASASQGVGQKKLLDIFADKNVSFKDLVDKSERHASSFKAEDKKRSENLPVSNVNADSPVRQFNSSVDAGNDTDEKAADARNNGQFAKDAPFTKEQREEIAEFYNSIKKDNAEGASSANNIILSEDAIKALKNSVEIEQGGVSSSSAPVSLGDLQTVAKQLQASDASLSDEDISTINEILPRLAENGVPVGMSAQQVISQVIEQVKSASGTEGVDSILNKMNFANSNSKDGLSAEQLAQQAQALQQVAGVDIAKIASKVIAVAKDEASKPQIPASNIRLLQVASLVKKRDENEQAISNDMDIAGVQVSDGSEILADAQYTNESKFYSKDSFELLQNVLLGKQISVGDQKTIDDVLAGTQNLSSQQASNNVQNIAVNNPVNTNDFNPLASGIKVPNLQDVKYNTSDGIENINGGAMSSENFVKFQNILEGVQGAMKSSGSNFLRNANEVLAQIKFGLSGMAKDEQNISIQLHPKELGKVDITMQINNDGKTHVMVVAEKTDTLNMLQKEATSLREMLTDALKTDSGNLNFSFHEQGSDSWKQQFSDKAGRVDSSGSKHGNAGAEYLASQNYKYTMIATDGLDIRV